MKKKFNYGFHIVLLIFFCIILLTSIGYCFYYFHLGTDYFDSQAQSVAKGYANHMMESANDRINKAYTSVIKLAADASAVSGPEALDEFGEAKTEELGLECLCFLYDDAVEYDYGKEIAYVEVENQWYFVDEGALAGSKIFTDGITCEKYVAFYCPVYGASEIDSLIAYYEMESLLGKENLLHKDSEFGCLALTDGSMVKELTAEDDMTVTESNVYTYLHSLAENKSEADAVKKQAENNEEFLAPLSIRGEKYIVIGFPVKSLGEDYRILQLFEEDALLRDEQFLSKGIFAVSVSLAVLSVVVLIVCVMFIHTNKKKTMDEADIDPVLACNTYNKFAYEAKELLEQNRFARYAVINFDIYKFHYLRERLGSDETEKTLKYISDICKQMIDGNETFGHVMNDSFVFLMHYTEITDLAERIKLLGAVVLNYGASHELGMDIRLSVGVCLVPGDRGQDMQKMFSCAKIALQTNKNRIDAPYTIYDSSIASAYLEEAEFEVKMNSALKSKDFKLFFQPKYSISRDCVESAEVLVRWYNPETHTFIAPDKFIRLFEANGFVSELDHYVFEETCRFMNDLTSHGDRLVPLSVNVSRATAIKPDFLNFYVEKKKEYGVEDGFITLEFTETFASESYELLEQLLPVLKNNGFKCAIDDFGMGNSSLIAVKELPVDELKLDRALIRHSGDMAKDDALLKMLIDVSKNIGMKVTQEGVETREDMDRLRTLGCDTVQGYYYAKPMQTVDFIDFLQGDTSLAGVNGGMRSGLS